MSNSNTNLQTQSSNALHNAIIEAGSKDRPPTLAPGNYVQWISKIKRYIDTKPNSELIHYCLQNPPYTYQWTEKKVPVAEGSSETTTERYMENYKNVSQDIRDQLNAEAKAAKPIYDVEFVPISATITGCMCVDQLLQLAESECIVIRLKWISERQQDKHIEQWAWQSQEQKTAHHKLYDILKQHQNEVNEIRAERLAQPDTVTEDDEISKDKEIDKLMALISLSFKKIYKPTNNNLRTSSNTSRANQDNSPRINRGTGYDNQRAFNVAGARENKPKRVKDAAYHKEKMLLCKQEKAGVQLNAKQADWKDDTDDESDDQELEAHYMFMVQVQEITPDQVDNSGPIFDDEPMHKVQNNHDNYNVFAMENEHPEQPESSKHKICRNKDVNYASKVEIDCAKAKGDLMSYKIDFEKSSNAYTQKINDLNQTISDMKKELCAHQETISIMSQAKEAQIKLYKTREDKELDKSIAFRKQIKFLKKAQRANPRLYDIGCYNDNLALMLAPESDEMIRLDKESRSKLSDLIKPFDYDKLNNLYDWFIPQREKSAEQHYFPKPSKMSHTSSNNEFSKESFRKQPTLLEKRMDESIPWDQNCKKTVATDSTVKKSRHQTRKLYEQIRNASRTANFLEHKTPKCSTMSNTPLSSNSFAARTDNSLMTTLVVFQKSTCYIRDLRGNDLLTCSRGTYLYSITLQDSITPIPICIMAKATSSQAWLWHRHLSHLNFDTINLLSKNNIVNGLLKLKFVRDHLCSSYELGKAKRKSFHTKTTPSSKRRLQLLHMDLCGPMRVESINGKKYVLVIVDDYS
ncbi:retrovirus-related pol polyprotein from transposon TNT 1-94 [Tanacetum coccineum]